MTTNELYNAIKTSYNYAHSHCIYGRSDLYYPPGEGNPPYIDCVGLVLRAFYTLGIVTRAYNINDILMLCEKTGMKKTTDINDVYKRQCVVCMCPKNDRKNVAHVYYSLGGKNLNDISKYDLGSDVRIQAIQPFTHVPVNEWTDAREFLCAYYVDTEYKPCNDLDLYNGKTGMVISDTNIYTGAGTNFELVCGVSKGSKCIVYPVLVTNKKGNTFKLIRLFTGETGYIYHNSVALDLGNSYKAIITDTDGTLNVRCGIGLDKPVMGELAEGNTVKVMSTYTDKSGIEWANVETHTICGFVTTFHLRKI